MTKKLKIPKMSCEACVLNLLTIHHFFIWLPLFMVGQLKRLAMRMIVIAFYPIEAAQQSFGMVLEGLAKDYEALPYESDDSDDENEFVV